MRPSTLIAVLCLLAIPGPAGAQEEGLEAFGEVIDVRVLNLEVAVSAKDGRHAVGSRSPRA